MIFAFFRKFCILFPLQIRLNNLLHHIDLIVVSEDGSCTMKQKGNAPKVYLTEACELHLSCLLHFFSLLCLLCVQHFFH